MNSGLTNFSFGVAFHRQGRTTEILTRLDLAYGRPIFSTPTLARQAPRVCWASPWK
jgi:hypothetical protein